MWQNCKLETSASTEQPGKDRPERGCPTSSARPPFSCTFSSSSSRFRSVALSIPSVSPYLYFSSLLPVTCSAHSPRVAPARPPTLTLDPWTPHLPEREKRLQSKRRRLRRQRPKGEPGDEEESRERSAKTGKDMRNSEDSLSNEIKSWVGSRREGEAIHMWAMAKPEKF